MPGTQYDITTSVHTCLNTATQGTTLNTLGIGAIAVSNSTGDLENATNLDLWGNFQLVVTLGAAPADGDIIAELYILPEVNGTFPTNSTSITPAAKYLAGVFVAQGTSTSQTDVITAPLPPEDMRFVLINKDTSTFTAADTHYLRCKPFSLKTDA